MIQILGEKKSSQGDPKNHLFREKNGNSRKNKGFSTNFPKKKKHYFFSRKTLFFQNFRENADPRPKKNRKRRQKHFF